MIDNRQYGDSCSLGLLVTEECWLSYGLPYKLSDSVDISCKVQVYEIRVHTTNNKDL